MLIYKRISLKEFFKFIISKTCILDDCFERIRIEPFMIWDGNTVSPVRHTYVFATGHNSKSNFAECPDCTLGRNIGEKHFRWRPLLDIWLSLSFPRLSSEGRFGWRL